MRDFRTKHQIFECTRKVESNEKHFVLLKSVLSVILYQLLRRILLLNHIFKIAIDVLYCSVRTVQLSPAGPNIASKMKASNWSGKEGEEGGTNGNRLTQTGALFLKLGKKKKVGPVGHLQQESKSTSTHQRTKKFQKINKKLYYCTCMDIY